MALKHVLITGLPGVGKTTLVKKITDALRNQEIAVEGFYTEEIRQGRERIGFDIVCTSGERGMLARVPQFLPSSTSAPTVGKYHVTLNSFETVALPAISKGTGKCMLIIDEIGKMEMFSKQFQLSVRNAFDRKNIVILATIPVNRNRTLAIIDDLLKKPNVVCFTVSRENRDSLFEEIMDVLLKSLTEV